MPTDMNALIRLMATGAPALSNDQGMTGQEVDIPPPAPPSISSSPREGGRLPPGPIPAYRDPRDLPQDPRLIEQYPYDGLPADSYQEGPEVDPRFIGTVNTNPDGADMGPFYQSPEAKIWLDDIIRQGYSLDWGTKTAFNPETGDEFPIPTHFPKMA